MTVYELAEQRILRKIELEMCGCQNETEAKIARLTLLIQRALDEHELLLLFKESSHA